MSQRLVSYFSSGPSVGMNPRTPLSARWAQMSQQEQVIEKKRLEVLEKLEAQKKNKGKSGETNKQLAILNKFSNDGSFFEQFQKLAQGKKTEDTSETKQSDDKEKNDNADKNYKREEKEDKDNSKERESADRIREKDSDRKGRDRDWGRDRGREKDREDRGRDRDREERRNRRRSNSRSGHGRSRSPRRRDYNRDDRDQNRDRNKRWDSSSESSSRQRSHSPPGDDGRRRKSRFSPPSPNIPHPVNAGHNINQNQYLCNNDSSFTANPPINIPFNNPPLGGPRMNNPPINMPPGVGPDMRNPPPMFHNNFNNDNNFMMPPNRPSFGPPNTMNFPNPSMPPPRNTMPPPPFNANPYSQMPPNNNIRPPNNMTFPPNMQIPPNFMQGPPGNMMSVPPPIANHSVPPPNVPIHHIPEPKPIDTMSIPPPKPLDTMKIPPPAPLDAVKIPPPGPMNLQKIPPPMPICLTQIPKPKDLDLCTIPPPLTGNDDRRTGSLMDEIASQVARSGQEFEVMLIARSAQDPSLWFLRDHSSVEFKRYRELVNMYQRRNNDFQDFNVSIDGKYNQVSDDDKYEPEHSFQDSGDETDYSTNNNYNRPVRNYQDDSKRGHFSSDGNKGNIFLNDSNREEVKEDRKRRRKSRWGDAESTPSTSIGVPGIANVTSLGGVVPVAPVPAPPVVSALPISGEKPQLTRVTRSDPGLLQYALKSFGSTNLSEEDWVKCEDHYKISLLYQAMLVKRRELDNLAAKGHHKYEYDSDEETEGGTWEHKLRRQEMEATSKWANELTKAAQGKHHIGDFLPPEELKKFMDKYSAMKTGKEPDLSDYKEFKLKEDNIGFKMLQKLGWSEGEGLGADGSGIVNPINKGTPSNMNQGLGLDRSEMMEEGDDEFDMYRKRMMLAYRFRPNPMNNPRRPYY